MLLDTEDKGYELRNKILLDILESPADQDNIEKDPWELYLKGLDAIPLFQD